MMPIRPIRIAFLVAAVGSGALTPAVAPGQPCLDLKVFAGRGVGDSGPATAAVLNSPRNLALDAAGNIIVADAGNARVRRIDAASGTITTIAGNGAPGVPTDGAIATLTTLKEPSGVAVAGGDVFIADVGASVNAVWRLTADGILHRFAGSGIATGSIDGPGGDPADDLNDGQLAVFATLSRPVRVAVDAQGNVFISDLGNNLVRRVDAASGRISTVTTGLSQPAGIAFGAGTDLFIANIGTNQILKGSTMGGATTVFAGTGGVPGPVNDLSSDPPLDALAAPLNAAGEVAVDASGVVYIGGGQDDTIHKVTTDGLIHRVAGSGLAGASDGPGFLARFRSPGVALGPGQTLLIPDVDNNRIRRYDAGADAVTTIAGGDNLPGDGGSAIVAILDRPTGLAVDKAAGAVFVTEHDSHRVRRIDAAGAITTVVNRDGLNGSATDGLAAVTSQLRQPTGVAMASGSLLIADAVDQRVLVVDGAGVIHTFAGTTDTAGNAGDGGPATSALLNTPLRMAVAQDGSVYITDFNNNRIRKVDPSGIITTVAGGGGELRQPAGVAFDGAGNLYIADFGSNRVLRLDASGSLTPIAGSGTAGKLGDQGQAGRAQLDGPTDVAVAADGGLFIVDQQNNTLRYVAPGAGGTVGPASIILTVLGDGMPGFADGKGTLARLLIPTDVEIDAGGNLLIADRGNQRVRIATPSDGCTSKTTMCNSSAECDDHQPCTLDVCEPIHVCSHTALPADQCVPSCAAEPAGCIAGGGPGRFDCLGETLVKGLQSATPVVRCRDNDTNCDFDPTPGRCSFRMACCFNEPGCAAAGVSRFAAQGPAGAVILDAVAKMPAASRLGNAVVFSQPLATPDACTQLADVGVSLRKGGRKAGKLQIKTTAFGTTKRQRDADKLRLICLP